MAVPLLDAGVASAVCSTEHNFPAAAMLHRRPAPASYEPKTWDYDSIFSMHLHGQTKPSKESSLLQLASLKQRVRQQLLLEEEEEDNDELPNKLRIIDQLQSLGVAYHFEEEIKSILTSMHVHDAHLQLKNDLSSTALLFRMLRAHGIPASTDMLTAFFTDDNGALEAAGNINLMRDEDDTIDGLVALYEASYLAFPGEAMLDTARAFTIDRLQQQMMPSSMVGGSNLQLQEDIPLHLRAPRLQAIRSLKHHRGNGGGSEEIDPCIVQLAVEDFDRVQAVHRSELMELTRWWKDTKLGEKLPPSARDRLVECFFCAVCIAPEPRLAGCRDVLAKVGSLIVHLDDVYDVYGTLHELAAFTDAIAGNWDDDSATALLPEYMKAMLSAIRSTSTAAADRVLREHGHDVLPLYKKAWHELCEAFMVEAKWQHERVMPRLEEYLDNGWVTSTGPLLLLHALTMLPSSEQQKADSWLRDGDAKVVYPRLVELCSRIFRLCNDCATHEAESERGEGPSSIACLMSESSGGGASKEEARGAVADAIAVIWKEVNRELLAGSVDAATGIMCVNLARVIQCIYHDGDGITSPTDSRKQLVKDLLFTPIRTLL